MVQPQVSPPKLLPKIPRSFLRRFVDFLFGYDFFISYAWRYRSEDGLWHEDGRTYAVALNNALEKEGFQCFLDSNEYRAGDNWRLVGRIAIRKTSRLILIVTRGAIRSEPVEREIEAFLETNRDIIPIDCEGILREREKLLRVGTYVSPTNVLTMLSTNVLFVPEESNRLALGPTPEVLQKIRDRFNGDRQDRKRVRWLTYAVGAFAILAVISLLSAYVAELQRRESVRQKLLAEAASSINEADLLRETRGPKLVRSFELAADSYEKSLAAHVPAVDSQRAMLQAIELLPSQIGKSWTPFSNSGPITSLYALNDQMLFLQLGEAQEGQPYAVLGALDANGDAWRIARSFNKGDHGDFIMASENGRLLATKRQGRVVIWDVANGEQRAELPFDHQPDAMEGAELLALSAQGDHLAARIGRQVQLWAIRDSVPVQIRIVTEDYRFARYTVSPSGKWIAWAAQNEFVLIRIDDGKELIRRQITEGGGHVESLGFISDDEANDGAIFVSWSANQVKAQQPSPRRGSPHSEAALWRLDRDEVANADSIALAPDASLLRQNSFQMVFGNLQNWDQLSLVVLDSHNPVQWLNVESQISHTIGAAAGSGLAATFGRQSNDILIVHADGTARLWNPTSRQELLRFAGVAPIACAKFLLTTAGDETRPASERAVVTADAEGRVQAWALRRVPPTRLQYPVATVGVSPKRDKVLLDNGKLLAMAQVSRTDLPGVAQPSIVVPGITQGSTIRLNSTSTHAAIWIPPDTIRTHREESLKWIDIKAKMFKELSLGEFGDLENCVVSEDGKHVIAWQRDSDKGPRWLDWDVAKPEDTAPTALPLRTSKDADEIQSVGYVILDPLGRFIWQLTPDGKLSRDDGRRARIVKSIDSRHLGQLSTESDGLVAPDGSYIAFPLVGSTLFVQTHPERTVEYKLNPHESVISVSPTGLLAVGETISSEEWTKVRVVQPFAPNSKSHLWSLPQDLVVRRFEFGSGNDWAAMQTDVGDVSVYSIRDERKLADLPRLSLSSRLEFVGNDRLLLMQHNGVATIHFWQPDDLLRIGRWLIHK